MSEIEYPEFNGQIALVTGAAQGIGAAVAQGLLRCGARVAALDRSAAGLTALAAEHAGRVLPLSVDVADAAAVTAAVNETEAALGPITLAASVAGVLRMAPLLELSSADWQHCWSINASGVLHVGQAVGRRMAARRRGSIVTVGSNAAGVPRMQMGAYAASKAAATALTMTLGLELAAANVRCNVVSPGSTDTAMQRGLWSGPESAAGVITGDPATFRLGIPLGRIAQPADVAAAVLFLLSDRARHITLHDLRVDGGATLDQ